jgi:hypothetical protein
MTLAITPADVVAVWQRTVVVGRAEIAGTTSEHSRALGSDLGDLGVGVAVALRRLEGAATTATALIDELTTNVGDCLAAYAATDHASAGVFNGLAR